jgi:hypothetical protein
MDWSRKNFSLLKVCDKLKSWKENNFIISSDSYVRDGVDLQATSGSTISGSGAAAVG